MLFDNKAKDTLKKDDKKSLNDNSADLKTGFKHLPPTIVQTIVDFLSPREALKTCSVNLFFNSTIKHHDIWKRMLREECVKKLLDASGIKLPDFKTVFRDNLAARKPQYLTFDRKGKNYILKRVLDNQHDDFISRYLRNEVTLDDRQSKRINDVENRLEQATNLHPQSRKNLESAAVRGFIANGSLTLEQAINLHPLSRYNLESTTVRAFIANGDLTLEKAINLYINSLANLESVAVRSLIANGSLTLEQAINLEPNRRQALEEDWANGRLEPGAKRLKRTLS